MRIAVVTHEASLTGAPLIAARIVGDLRKQGHDVTVVARRRGPLLRRFGQDATCRIEPLARLRDRLWQHPTTRWLATLLETLTAFVSIAVARPDILYLNSTASAAYLRPALWLRRHCVLHVHEDYDTAQMFLRACRAEALIRRAVIVACVPSIRRDVSRLSGVPVESVLLVEYITDPSDVEKSAVDAERPDLDDGEIVIGACATVEYRKGTDLWLQAVTRIREQRPERPIRFIWVGAVRDESLIRGFEECFVGPRSNPFGFMRRFDVLTVPSRSEAGPLVVLEAMSLGVPVVAFDVGSARDHVGATGRVVEPEDVNGLAAAVTELIDDEKLRARLGDQARERSRELHVRSDFAGGLSRALADAVSGRVR
ncbi:MAG TPA: glycosyltransferase [Mycobacteriales bacterium]|nr:glycosyltransferase [Mycobacteriales bacterium]